MPSALYRIESLGRHLGVGVAGSRYVYLSAVAKENVANAPYCIPNELICGELGRFLRLPVPPAGIVTQAGGSAMVASLDFNLTGNSLPPVNVNQCVRMLPTLSAGLLLFDIWIANCDRHEANFSLDTGTTPPQMSIFDHSHALVWLCARAGRGTSDGAAGPTGHLVDDEWPGGLRAASSLPVGHRRHGWKFSPLVGTHPVHARLLH